MISNMLALGPDLKHELVRRDDPRTWMEIYEHVHDTRAFEAALAAAVLRHGVDAHVPDGRHVESFVDHP